jgi:hypothetical protein
MEEDCRAEPPQVQGRPVSQDHTGEQEIRRKNPFAERRGRAAAGRRPHDPAHLEATEEHRWTQTRIPVSLVPAIRMYQNAASASATCGRAEPGHG